MWRIRHWRLEEECSSQLEVQDGLEAHLELQTEEIRRMRKEILEYSDQLKTLQHRVGTLKNLVKVCLTL